MHEKLLKLKELLDTEYSGEFDYTFKFIVPLTSLEELKRILNNDNIIEKPSRKGKYVSVTLKVKVQNGQEVVDVYEQVAGVKGLLSL